MAMCEDCRSKADGYAMQYGPHNPLPASVSGAQWLRIVREQTALIKETCKREHQS